MNDESQPITDKPILENEPQEQITNIENQKSNQAVETEQELGTSAQPQVVGPAQSIPVDVSKIEIQGNNFNSSVTQTDSLNWYEPIFVYISVIAGIILAGILSQVIQVIIFKITDLDNIATSESIPVAYYSVTFIIEFIFLIVGITISYYLTKMVIKSRSGDITPIKIGYFVLLLISVYFSVYFFALGVSSLFPVGREGLAPLGIFAAFMFFSPVFFVINIVSVKLVNNRIRNISVTQPGFRNYELLKSTLILCRKLVIGGIFLAFIGYIFLNISYI